MKIRRLGILCYQGSVEVDAFGGVANCFFWFSGFCFILVLCATDFWSFEIHGWASLFYAPRPGDTGTSQPRVLRLIPLPYDLPARAGWFYAFLYG